MDLSVTSDLNQERLQCHLRRGMILYRQLVSGNVDLDRHGCSYKMIHT